MNPVDALLRDELNRLLDRIAVSTRAGVAKVSATQLPDLRARLDEAEERLAAKREALLKEYADWRGALGACEGLWGLAPLELGEAQAGSLRAAQQGGAPRGGQGRRPAEQASEEERRR